MAYRALGCRSIVPSWPQAVQHTPPGWIWSTGCASYLASPPLLGLVPNPTLPRRSPSLHRAAASPWHWSVDGSDGQGRLGEAERIGLRPPGTRAKRRRPKTAEPRRHNSLVVHARPGSREASLEACRTESRIRAAQDELIGLANATLKAEPQAPGGSSAPPPTLVPVETPDFASAMSSPCPPSMMEPATSSGRGLVIPPTPFPPSPSEIRALTACGEGSIPRAPHEASPNTHALNPVARQPPDSAPRGA